MVDIRLTLIILGGSLLGVQLGAIGTTYVKEHMIKIVMGTIMLIVAVSRALAVPEYLVDLRLMSMDKATIGILKHVKLYFHVYCLDRRRSDYPGRHVAGQGGGSEKSQGRICDAENPMAAYKNILLGVDGSDASLHAFTEGVRLAGREVKLVAVSVAPEYNGDLRLVGVHDPQKLITPALRCGLVPVSGSRSKLWGFR